MRALNTPLDVKTVKSLGLGDIVTLSGRIFTARDQAHILMLRAGVPRDLATKDLAVYHCGPIVKRVGADMAVTSAGPTTSMRMESLEPEFIRMTGVRAVIGKGGMGQATLEAMKRHGAVYLSITGGVGALAMRQLGPAKAVHFLEELGPVEAVWEFDAKYMGPLVVTMDSHGNSLHDAVSAETKANLDRILAKRA
jgi:tartrate/fumarate subfamily iron-sulfur-dependent hydro-lyase beta chain